VVDLHSHILPGVDDGSKSWEMTLEMCRLAAQDGTTDIAATPHMLDGVHRVHPDKVRELVAELRPRLAAAGIPLVVHVGGDVHVGPDLLERLAAGEALTLGDTGKYLLVEFPHEVLPAGALDLMFRLRVKGIQPVFTHPERNLSVQDRPAVLREWAEMEILLQVTAGSFTGGFGRAAQEVAMTMAREGLAHIVASDAHDTGRRGPGMSAARESLRTTMDEAELRAAFELRPRYILEGRPLSVPQPRPAAPPPSIFTRWLSWKKNPSRR